MLHKYKFDRIPADQPPGAITRLWHKTYVTGPLTALPPRSIYDQATEEHVAIPAPDPYRMPRFVEYRADVPGEDCLVMLYKTCLLCIDTYRALPDELFVSSQIIPSIRKRSQFIGDMPYNGKYRLFAGGDLRHVPIRTAEYLPPIIKLAVNDRLHTDQVIGLIS